MTYLMFWWQRDPLVVDLSFCLYKNTIFAEQQKVHFAYFVQREQHEIIAKHLT